MKYSNVTINPDNTFSGKLKGMPFTHTFFSFLIEEGLNRNLEFNDLIDSLVGEELIDRINYSSQPAKNLMFRRALNFFFGE